MANQPKSPRTLLADLPAAEQELTTDDMKNVQGGKTFYESRRNEIASATPPSGTTSPTTTANTKPTTNSST